LEFFFAKITAISVDLKNGQKTHFAVWDLYVIDAYIDAVLNESQFIVPLCEKAPKTSIELIESTD